MATRWYLAYAVNYRDIEEHMAERGVAVDHSTVNRWIIEYAPQLENEFRKKHKTQVGCSWRMDETYVKIKGQYMLRKEQHADTANTAVYEQFYALAA